VGARADRRGRAVHTHARALQVRHPVAARALELPPLRGRALDATWRISRHALVALPLGAPLPVGAAGWARSRQARALRAGHARPWAAMADLAFGAVPGEGEGLRPPGMHDDGERGVCSEWREGWQWS